MTLKSQLKQTSLVSNALPPTKVTLWRNSKDSTNTVYKCTKDDIQYWFAACFEAAIKDVCMSERMPGLMKWNCLGLFIFLHIPTQKQTKQTEKQNKKPKVFCKEFFVVLIIWTSCQCFLIHQVSWTILTSQNPIT